MESESERSEQNSVHSWESWEVGDFSPPPSPEVDREVGVMEAGVEEASGPEPYQFEPLARELAGAVRGADGAEAATAADCRMGLVSDW